MVAQAYWIHVQCRAADARVGDFIASEDRAPVSPVFEDLATLFAWMADNDWRLAGKLGPWRCERKEKGAVPERRAHKVIVNGAAMVSGPGHLTPAEQADWVRIYQRINPAASIHTENTWYELPLPRGYRDSGEGPFKTSWLARRFALAEVGVAWEVFESRAGWHIAVKVRI